MMFTDFYSLPEDDYYWYLPEKFLKNKVNYLISKMNVVNRLFKDEI